MKEDCKQCKNSTSGACEFHTKFIIGYDYDAIPRYIFNWYEWQHLKDNLYDQVLIKQEKFF